MIIIINDVMQWIMHTLICFFNLSVKYETVSATTQEKKHEITPMYPDSSSFTPKGLKLRVITAFVKRKVIFLNPHDNYYSKYYYLLSSTERIVYHNLTQFNIFTEIRYLVKHQRMLFSKLWDA